MQFNYLPIHILITKHPKSLFFTQVFKQICASIALMQGYLFYHSNKEGEFQFYVEFPFLIEKVV